MERLICRRFCISSSIAGLLVLVPLVLCRLATASERPGKDTEDAYLFTSFRGNGEDGLRFAFSDDGYRWQEIPGTFLKPAAGESKLMRDPSLVRGPDGTFHLVWTTGWQGDQGFGYASSKDLVHWSAQRFIPVMEHEPTTVNVWAPEIYYDRPRDRFIICWASTIPGRFPDHLEPHDNNQRMYYTTTKDFKAFAPTQLFFDPGFSVIDAAIVNDGSRYVLVLKENTRPSRCLRVAFGDSPLGPWRDVSAPFTENFTEGPTVLKLDDDWIIYYDAYRAGIYGAAKTRDFKSFTDIAADVSFPSGHKHGTVVRATRAEVQRLIDASRHRAEAGGRSAQHFVLDPNDFAGLVARFNRDDEEDVVNAVPNAAAWDWITENAPLFDCPDQQLAETYYFRWWTFRKHIKVTPHGRVLTEFITPVGHAGPYNTISCAFGHHLAEGRWLQDAALLDEYTRFWFRSGKSGSPADHFHKFSSWAAAAIWDRYLVTHDRAFVVDLLDDLIRDYERWEEERQRPDGLFWQYDVADGMEESISGGRHVKNIRPTINSYMAANAHAIAKIAALAGRHEVSERFDEKAAVLRAKMIEALWDAEAGFFKVRRENGELSDAREVIGFIPWMFGLAGEEHAIAWRQLTDPAGFAAPHGLTTAERRHPDFRTHGTGTCEWDGAVWPFATSQTLRGLANLLRGPDQPYVTREDFMDELLRYSRAHMLHGQPYIGEYHDELTGAWLITGPKAERSRYYNHSTFNDLVIGGLVGIVPRADDVIEIDPLLPEDPWDWFCLDGVAYHGRNVTVLWDRTGEKYRRGAGLAVYVDGEELVRASTLRRVTAELPARKN